MVNIITSQIIVDGSRVTVVKYDIIGDGSGDEVKSVLYDASAFSSASIDNALLEIEYELNGFDAQLFWDATTDVPLIPLASDTPHKHWFECFGGIPNNAGIGKTGDILLSTRNLDSGDTGFIILRIKQKV